MATSPIYYKSSVLIKRLFREHLWQYRRKLMFAVGCMVIVASCTAGNAWLMQPALDKIFIEHDKHMLTLIPFAIISIAITGAFANYGNLISMRFIGLRVVAELQVRLFSHLMISDIGFFHEQASGRLISRFTHDINLLRNSFTNIFTSLAKESLSLVFLVGVMIYQNPQLSLIALVVFPVGIFPIIRLSKSMRRISDTTQNHLGEFVSSLDEIFKGVRTVKSYNREDFEMGRARANIEKLFRLYFKGTRKQVTAGPMMEVLSGVSIGLVIWYGGFQVMDGKTTPGAFFSFVTAFLMAYRPVRAMAGLNTTLQEGLAAANRLFAVIDTPPAIFDHPGVQPLMIHRGDIRFENVTFRYAEGGRGVENANFHVPAGKTAALVGLSGGGKSTLMNLLLRFFDVEAGRIVIDDQDIRNVTLYSLREAMAFVPQESMLFDDTIWNNIAYGREGATEEEIIEAARNAAADEFIRAMPEGYDTMIGSHGIRLSGGQRQRIAIARAMLKNAPILLLDEATSSLDNESERTIQQALSRLMYGRTTLVIAHRLSTIVNADIIYVVENGHIVETGTHATLMAKQGKYAGLYSQNFAAA